jgi:hypothetical protein
MCEPNRIIIFPNHFVGMEWMRKPSKIAVGFIEINYSRVNSQFLLCTQRLIIRRPGSTILANGSIYILSRAVRPFIYRGSNVSKQIACKFCEIPSPASFTQSPIDLFIFINNYKNSSNLAGSSLISVAI